ncbi:hypothetical protein AAHC03_021033 [Spirometra sp. Aus1]
MCAFLIHQSRGLDDSVTLEDELSYDVSDVDASAVVTSEPARDGSGEVGVRALSFSNLNNIILQKIHYGPMRNFHPWLVWAISESNLIADEAFAQSGAKYSVLDSTLYTD